MFTKKLKNAKVWFYFNIFADFFNPLKIEKPSENFPVLVYSAA